MKFTTSSVILAAALGVSAHPSGHVHQRAHNSLQARGGFVMANKPAVVPTSTSVAVATPTATPSAAAAPAKDATSGGNGTGVSTYTKFCQGGNSKRATAAEIAYKGNVGSGGDYGCNIMAIQNHLVSQYEYTLVFNNAGGDAQCACWNKIGPDGGINGFFNGNEAIKFSLPAGAKQAVAIDSNSQMGCTCGEGSIPLTPIGQFAGTWIEGDVGNLSNGGWSGFDASSLASVAAGMDIPGLNVCGTGPQEGICSTIFPGGTGKNAFTAGTAEMDGLGLNCPPGPQSIIVTVGYQG